MDQVVKYHRRTDLTFGTGVNFAGIIGVSGDVVRPGYFEFEVGSITMGELIYDLCGGLKPGRTLKAIIPGGSSAKVLRAGERYKIKEKQTDGTTVDKEIGVEDIILDFDSLAAIGSMAGSGGVMVMDDTRDIIDALTQRYPHIEQSESVLCSRKLRSMHPLS